MDIFFEHGIEWIPHFTPLHYLPFIARAQSLKSKASLRQDGYASYHFRSKSKNTDEKRGFGASVFLTLESSPRILQAKLSAGFPHIAVCVPVSAVCSAQFDLCRYNVAMSRRLPSSPKGGFTESSTNGRYYGDNQIPVARDWADKAEMLNEHFPVGTMIEVLVDNELPLPPDTQITCYHEADAKIAKCALLAEQCGWRVSVKNPGGAYNRNKNYVEEVEKFVSRSLQDKEWKGNGIEFDNLKAKK